MSDNNLTERKIMEVLDWTYDKALAGGMGIDSAQELAESYLKEKGSLEDKINSLIRWQNTKSAVVFKKLCHFLKLLKTGMMHYGNYI